MSALAKLIAKFGYKKIMQLIGEGWTVNQIEKMFK
ncbi:MULTISPECIES: enterocin L50 family leaderless bacteriocin [Bacilli]|uniref:Bacteriocin-like protein n=1 Tax=Ligilactobacillus salivarius TaxID=1624 RepID=A0A089RZU8_9LACO|nr:MULTISPECIES: enterocin L50 family leaderless bacteriocin [Bacilli]PEG96021.1 enterocin L50 family leaderless bacteriocin [Lactobacillus sp. UMNPBX9]PEH09392.1 enterocin L50 family leaderless bacteriocin [Lactobacillus sp. UMNPBX2]HIS18904.1 enterocin L50 family leaderless bacteriocin [Candidatus Coprovivens excrementavium]AIR11912.1 Bacteriocin-like protein [Ligilactobacillus salivarius]ATP36631.1 enterocin L50 family leaderless bacteriocin [Ligilactobacillus salivarius]